MPSKTSIFGSRIRSGSIPTTSLTGGVISSSVQLPNGIVSSSTQFNTLTNTSASFATTASNLNGGTVNYIPLWTSVTAQSSSTIFQSNGNIGIGTTTFPGGTGTYRLYTAGRGYFSAVNDLFDGFNMLTLDYGSGQNSDIYAIQFREGGATNAAIGFASYDASNRADLKFWVNNGSVLTTRMIINSSGSVGIGTTNPSSSLDIHGILTTKNVVENTVITGSDPTSALTLDLSSGSLQYRSGSTTAHWTTNFRWDAATTLNSVLYPGQSITVTLIVNNATTAYSASTHQVDGKSFTPRWQGRTLPSASANSTDMYTYTIIKLASASYDIFGSQTTFG